jgi:hypothetical protein
MIKFIIKDNFGQKRLEDMIKQENCNCDEPIEWDVKKSRSRGLKKLVFYRGQNKRKVPPITLPKLSSDK